MNTASNPLERYDLGKQGDYARKVDRTKLEKYGVPASSPSQLG